MARVDIARTVLSSAAYGLSLSKRQLTRRSDGADGVAIRSWGAWGRVDELLAGGRLGPSSLDVRGGAETQLLLLRPSPESPHSEQPISHPSSCPSACTCRNISAQPAASPPHIAAALTEHAHAHAQLPTSPERG
jgi:hypothetical protein